MMQTSTILIFVVLHVVMAMVPLAFNIETSECDRESNRFACAGNPINALPEAQVPDDNADDDEGSGFFGAVAGVWDGLVELGGQMWGAAKSLLNLFWTLFSFNYDWISGGPTIQQYSTYVLRMILGTVQAILIARIAMSLTGRQL